MELKNQRLTCRYHSKSFSLKKVSLLKLERLLVVVVVAAALSLKIFYSAPFVAFKFISNFEFIFIISMLVSLVGWPEGHEL